MKKFPEIGHVLNMTEEQVEKFITLLHRNDRKQTYTSHNKSTRSIAWDNSQWYYIKSSSTKPLHLYENIVEGSSLEIPKNWHVVVTEENQEVVSTWRGVGNLRIGKIVGMTLGKNGILEKGHNSSGDIVCDTGYYNFGEEKSFEWFKENILKEKFTFPEKWFIPRNEAYKHKDILVPWLQNNSQTRSVYTSGAFEKDGMVYPKNYGSHLFVSAPAGYTEITFEQFKQYVLKESNTYVDILENSPIIQFPIEGKMRVTPEQSRMLQEKLFSLGYVWSISNIKEQTTVQYIHSPFIYWRDTKYILHGVSEKVYLGQEETEYQFSYLFNDNLFNNQQTTDNGKESNTRISSGSGILQGTFETNGGSTGGIVLRPYSGGAKITSSERLVNNTLPHRKPKGSILKGSLGSTILSI